MLVFKTWEGELKNVAAKEGETLLQVARREDLPSMEGVCGGHLGE
jgi:ferredoxin